MPGSTGASGQSLPVEKWFVVCIVGKNKTDDTHEKQVNVHFEFGLFSSVHSIKEFSGADRTGHL